MARFNPAKYDPRNDSTPDRDETAADLEQFGYDETGAVLIDQTSPFEGEPSCHCGCYGQPRGGKSRFLMGHDARFKGVLLRAHLTATPIVLIEDDGAQDLTALDVAARYDGKHSWTQALRQAYSLQAVRDLGKPAAEPKPAPAPKPTGPQAGDTRLVKIGRWTRTAEVVSADTKAGTMVVRYVEKTGAERTATVAIPA